MRERLPRARGDRLPESGTDIRPGSTAGNAPANPPRDLRCEPVFAAGSTKQFRSSSAATVRDDGHPFPARWPPCYAWPSPFSDASGQELAARLWPHRPASWWSSRSRRRADALEQRHPASRHGSQSRACSSHARPAQTLRRIAQPPSAHGRAAAAPARAASPEYYSEIASKPALPTERNYHLQQSPVLRLGRSPISSGPAPTRDIVFAVADPRAGE